MSKKCKNCGADISGKSKFCIKCGAQVGVEMSGEKPVSGGITFGEYIKLTVSEVVKMLKKPKLLFKAAIPSVIIAAVWFALSFLEMAFPKNIGIRVLSFFTYAQGGMFGGFFGALGGIVGKVLFAYLLCTIVNAVLSKRKIKFKEIFAGFRLNCLSALGCFLVGAGGAILLYLAMNITSSAQNSAIGIVSAVTVIMAASRKNGLLVMAVCGVAKFLTRGKAPSQETLTRVMSGMTTGFVVAVPLSLPRQSWICPVACIALLAVGILMLLFRGKNKPSRTASAAIALVILILPLISLVSAADGYKAGDWVTAEEFCNLYAIDLNYAEEYAGDTVGEKIKDSESRLIPDAVEVSVASFEISDILYARQGAEQNFSLLTYDTFNGEGTGSKYVLNSEESEICLTNSEDTVCPGAFQYSYDYNLENIVLTYDDTMYYGSDSPFELDFTVSGNHSAFYSATGNYGDTYSETYGGKCENQEESGGVKLSISENGEIILVASFSTNSETASSSYGKLKLRVERVRLANRSGGGAGGGLFGLLLGGEDEDGGEELTKSDETRKGVPLNDYDRDGDIDYLDRVIQYELIHDPDYLTRHGTIGAVIVALSSVISALFGGAVGAVGAGASAAASAAAGTAATASVGNTNQYISFDYAGDIEWTDPATGKKTQYVKQKDGTYKNPLTDMKYTYDELVENAEYRERNAENFAEDAETAEQNVEEQRDANSGLSDHGKQYLADKKRLEKLAADRNKMIALANKYNLPDDMDKDDFVESVLRKLDKERERGERFAAQGDRMEIYEKSAETVAAASDLGMDALATATGPAGKAINAGYKIAKGSASKGAEEYNASDGNVTTGILQGAIEGSIDAANDYLGGGAKAAGTVVGESAKSGLDAYIKGKDVMEGVKEGALKGTANAAIDAGADFATDKLKNIAKPGGDTAGLTKHINEAKDDAAKKIAANYKSAAEKIDFGGSIADNAAKKGAEKAMEKDD